MITETWECKSVINISCKKREPNLKYNLFTESSKDTAVKRKNSLKNYEDF